MKFNANNIFQPLTITLETPEEVYRMLDMAQAYMTPYHREHQSKRYEQASIIEEAVRNHYNKQDQKVGA